MKIAVYIVGQWRGTSYQCAENLKKIFDKFDTDYYIHTRPFYEGKNLNLVQYDIDKNPIVEHENYIHTEQDLENIKNTYNNVVSFEVEPYDIEKDTQRHATFFQYYSAYKTNEARKLHEKNTGVEYDVIVKIRPDIIFGDTGIKDFIKRIEYVKKNPLSIFSFYSTKLKPDTYYHWDFYTISSPFGMDCMVKWVRDVINNETDTEIFSSNYVIDNNLVQNPDIDKHSDTPTPQLMREVYKYNNLIEDFYNQTNLYKNNPNDPDFILHLINHYLYNFNTDNNSIAEYFNNFNLENREAKFVNRGLYEGWNKFLTENELKELADLIKNKVNESNIHATNN